MPLEQMAQDLRGGFFPLEDEQNRGDCLLMLFAYKVRKQVVEGVDRKVVGVIELPKSDLFKGLPAQRGLEERKARLRLQENEVLGDHLLHKAKQLASINGRDQEVEQVDITDSRLRHQVEEGRHKVNQQVDVFILTWTQVHKKSCLALKLPRHAKLVVKHLFSFLFNTVSSDKEVNEVRAQSGFQGGKVVEEGEEGGGECGLSLWEQSEDGSRGQVVPLPTSIGAAEVCLQTP